MTDLSRRLEMLTGPDHKVDEEIAKAIGWVKYITWTSPNGRIYADCPNFTNSLDAAMTLMPAALKNTILLQTSSPAKAGFGRDGKKFTYFEGATAPIALCIAALKAREVEDADECS